MRAPAYVTGDYIGIRVIASESEAIRLSAKKAWIASSQVLLAMTAKELNMPSRQNWFEGWRLFAVLTLTLVALSVWIAGMRQFEVDGVRMVIRFTARTSLLLFCLAFSAAALAQLWPNAWTRWQRRNRRALGVTFAASHGVHAVAITAFAVMDPAAYAAATSIASYVFGGIGYAFIVAMTATSFDRTTQALGARAWRMLHLVGGYYLLFQFMVSFGKRIPDMPLYALFLIPLVAVFTLRMISMAAARTPRRVLTG
jgi:sulfoxide reductase heme-binding subunit YedZ